MLEYFITFMIGMLCGAAGYFWLNEYISGKYLDASISYDPKQYMKHK